MNAASFDGLGNADGSFDIQSLVPVVPGGAADLYTGCMTIMTMTDGGETAESYGFIPAAESADGKDGWFNDIGQRVNKTFAPGEGFVLVSDFEEGTLQSAGQVANKDTIFVMIPGVNSCGNTSSATIDIGDIKVGSAVTPEGELVTTDLYTGCMTYMTLTDGGETANSYGFIPAAESTDGQDGWFNDVGARVTLDIPAGQGFIIVNDFEGGAIKIPSAL